MSQSSPEELINRRMRQVILHSTLYYMYDVSIIPDTTFDRWSRELVELIAAHPAVAQAHPFWSDFKDFDGSTGYQFANHPWGIEVAQRFLRESEEVFEVR